MRATEVSKSYYGLDCLGYGQQEAKLKKKKKILTVILASFFHHLAGRDCAPDNTDCISQDCSNALDANNDESALRLAARCITSLTKVRNAVIML